MNRLYTVKHKGCAILCGAAPCLFEDLAEAKKIRPDADILGVKYAASLVPEIEHIWTQHGEKTISIKKAAGRTIYVHARPRTFQTPGGTLWYLPHKKEAFEAIDYVWDSLSYAVGSSGLAGALWARHGMGYDEVILAGIPLSVNNAQYAEGYPNKYQNKNSYASADQIDNWVKALKDHIKNDRMIGVYSMSGATRKLLGPPP
jgi:hypothetical protein